MIPEYIRALNPFKKNKNVINSSPIDGSNEIKDKIEYINSEFDYILSHENDNLERSSESWNLYKGYGGSSYASDIKSELTKDGRNPFEGNIIRQKVDGLAGSIIKNFFDVGYTPVNGNMSPITQYATELMYIDKELMDWNASYRQLIVDGLIYLGVEEIYIDFRYSPFGNIGFRTIQPNHILLDPDWITNNAWDLKRAFKVAYLLPRQIKEIYETKSEEIDNAIKIRQGNTNDYYNGDTDEGVMHYGLNEQYGNKYRVIEFYHMEKEKKNIEIITASGLVVPEGTDEYKKEWAVLNDVDLSMGVMKRTIPIDTCYVTSIVPTLSNTLILEDKPTLIQIGRLPFFPWSSGRINGINSGIPDLLKSIQQTYNYRESMLDFQISTSATAMAMDPDIVGGDEARMSEVERNINKGNYKFWTEQGALSSGRNFFQPIPRQPVNYDVVNEINRMIDMADRVSKQPAAMEGRSEGSEETGILYARKTLQAEMAQTLLMKSLEQHENDKGEAYLLTAKKLYSGVYREFYAFGSGRKIEINKPIVTVSGEVIENDISELPRMKVIVTQSPEGVTTRLVNRSINTELLRVLGPETPISRVRAVKKILESLDDYKKEKDEHLQDSELELQLARENVITNILNLKASQAQLQMQFMGGGMAQGQPQEQQEEVETTEGQGNPSSNIEGNTQAMTEQL
jgi:hypothetical protein